MAISAAPPFPEGRLFVMAVAEARPDAVVQLIVGPKVIPRITDLD